MAVGTLMHMQTPIQSINFLEFCQQLIHHEAAFNVREQKTINNLFSKTIDRLAGIEGENN